VKLLFIYGPPAVGKLTIARELEKRTGYKLFHNHVSAYFVKSVFEYGCESYFDLLQKIRLDMFGAAAQHDVSLITTFVYAPPDDDEFLANMVEAVEEWYGGEIIFIQLDADVNTLRRRVVEDSRKEFQKIHTVEGLNECLERWELGVTVPYDNVLKIDTTGLSVDEVMEQINQQLSL